MTKTIQQTSLTCYKELADDGILCARQSQVLSAFKAHGCHTNLEISRITGLPINTITGRVRELVKMGLLEEIGKKRDTTGRTAIIWGSMKK